MPEFLQRTIWGKPSRGTELSLFRVAAVLLWLMVGVTGAIGLIDSARHGVPPNLGRALLFLALAIALGIGLWVHSKVVAVLYIALTTIGALWAAMYAFRESPDAIGAWMGALWVTLLFASIVEIRCFHGISYQWI